MEVTWHSIPDSVAYSLRNSLPGPFWVAGRDWYRWYWSWYMEQELTMEEADSIRGRLNGFGPIPFEETWESVERNDGPSFWRSQVIPTGTIDSEWVNNAAGR